MLACLLIGVRRGQLYYGKYTNNAKYYLTHSAKATPS